MLASLLFPYDDDAKKLIDKWLGELEAENCIKRYQVGGDSYLWITEWSKHQKIDKPSQSRLPAFDAGIEHSQKIREDSPRTLEVSSEDLGRDLGREKKGSGPASAEPQSDSAPPFVVMPLVDGSEFGVTVQQVEEWTLAYPAVNVGQQLREMRQWCIANPTHRKTQRGILRFITTWMGKEQDRAPMNGRGSVSALSFRERDQAAAKQRAHEVSGGLLHPELAKQPKEFFDELPRLVGR